MLSITLVVASLMFMFMLMLLSIVIVLHSWVKPAQFALEKLNLGIQISSSEKLMLLLYLVRMGKWSLLRVSIVSH